MERKIIGIRKFEEVIKIYINDYIIKKYEYPIIPDECEYLLLFKPSLIEIKSELQNIERHKCNCIIVAIVPETHMLLLKNLYREVIVINECKLNEIENILRNHSNSYEKEKISFSYKEELFLREVAYGLNNKEIAYELMLSDRSVRRIKEKLLSKTGLSNTQQLMLYAINKGY